MRKAKKKAIARRKPRATRKPSARPAAAGEKSDLRKLKGRVSRDRILDSALEHFSKRGYAASGVHDIARAAGIEKTALYWHFGSKEGLLAAVIDRLDAEFVDRVAQRVARSTGDSDDRLDVFVAGLERLASERGELIRLMLSVSIERAHVSAETRSAMERIFERTRVAVAQGFEQALGVKLPDVDLIARLVLAYLWEAAVRDQVEPQGVEHERFFAHLRRLIVLDIGHQLAALGATADASRRPVRA